MKCRWYVTRNTTALGFGCEGQCTQLIRGFCSKRLHVYASGMYEGSEGAWDAKIFKELFTVRGKPASGKQAGTGGWPGPVVFDPLIEAIFQY